MIACSLEEIAAIVGGRLADVPDPAAVVFRPAVIDSRQAGPGSLFVALPGEHVDGHDFAASAVRAGAVAVLGTRPVGVPSIVVDDVLAALAALAQHVRAQVPDLAVVALTGSAGKTSTKDLIAQILPEVLGPTAATMKSFNNELGLPLTVLLTEPGTRYLVLEMGARHAGHIAHLTGIVPPRVGLVINIGTAHVGEFGSRQAIADAKSELVRSLPAGSEGGLAILNADDPLVMGMTAATKARVMTFGRAESADVQVREVALDDAGRPRFTLVHNGVASAVRMALHGEHNVANAAAAAAVALGLGAELEQVTAALSRAVHVSEGRMQVLDRPDGVTIVNDAFNSSPDAAVLSLQALAAMRAGRRTVALLGEMRELGPDSDAGHARVGTAVAETGVDVLMAVGGADADTLLRAAVERRPDLEVVRAADRDEALSAARGLLRPGDLCLVKGSHAVGLEHTAMLLARPDDVAAPA